MKHLGDITKIDWFSVEPVDVVTGGSPCQDLSVAGKRAGLAGERSGLYMEQIRCVKELREADVLRGRSGQFIRPRFMVWENVPGAFSSGNPKGADFAAVIEELIKVAEPDAEVRVLPPSDGWTKSGCYYDCDGRWSIAWRVHDAQFWGVPQRRKRIALVADFGGLAAPEVLFERKGLSRDFEPCGTEREATSRSVGDGAESASGFQLGFRPENVRVYDETATTLCSGTRPGFCNAVIKQGNAIIPIHDKATRFQGGGPTRNGDGAGNGMGIGDDGDPCPTLSCGDHHMVFDARGNGGGKICPTITGDHQNRVTDYTALLMEGQ